MFGASLWFILLAMFYYEYVPEDAFAEQEAALKPTEAAEKKLEDETTEEKDETSGNTEKENEAFKSDEATHESADL